MFMRKRKAAIIGAIAMEMFGFVISSAKAQTASPCINSASPSRRVEFADISRARHLLGHPDAWTRQLSDFDLEVRQKTA